MRRSIRPILCSRRSMVGPEVAIVLASRRCSLAWAWAIRSSLATSESTPAFSMISGLPVARAFTSP